MDGWSKAVASLATAFFLGSALAQKPIAPACSAVQPPALKGTWWLRCANNSLWIIETRLKLSAFVANRPSPTLREQVRNQRAWLLAFNGAYHDGDYAHARLEGLHHIRGTPLAPLKPHDRQLTHVLTISADGAIRSLRAASRELMAALEPTDTHIQSGPLILERGKTANSSMDGSLNGNDPYKRTAIGMTADGATVIVLARTPRRLQELGELLLRMPRYANRSLSLLNLDGGPSSALHAGAVPGLSYGADKVTPVGFALQAGHKQ